MPQLIGDDSKIRRVYLDQLVFLSSSPLFGAGTLKFLILVPGLREAKKHDALKIWKGEYLDALSAVAITQDMQDLLARKQQFADPIEALYSPESSDVLMEAVAARLGPLFSGSIYARVGPQLRASGRAEWIVRPCIKIRGEEQ